MSCTCLKWPQLSMGLSSLSDSNDNHAAPQGTDSQSKPIRGFSEGETDRERTIIKNGFLYCADENNRIIKKAWVLIEGGRVLGIGDMDEAIPEHDSVIEAKNKMILPGFVNPHWHESFVAPNHERPDEKEIEPGPYSNGGDIEALGSMFGFISGVGKAMTLQEGVAIARWSLWTQLRSGTTALGDLGSANSADALAMAALDMGIRLRVSRWGADICLVNDGNSISTVANTQEQADDWVDLLEKWNNHPSGLLGGMPSVMGAFGSSDRQLQALADITADFNVPYATHLAALKNERIAVAKAFNCSPVERFNDFGLLTDRLLAVHTAYASEKEYELLFDKKVNLCHAPAHYGMLGESTNSETKQFAKMLKAGHWVSSSTDGDIMFTGGMCEAMRGAHLQNNEALNCNTVCPPNLALKTGSLFGSKALGWQDKIGSIEVGKDADMVLVSIDDYRYQTSNHPLRTFLIAGSSADVDTVLIQGRTLVRSGRSTQFDETELYNDYICAAQSVRKRIGPPKSNN